MADEIQIGKGIFGGLVSVITFVLGFIGIQGRQNANDIKEIPDKYVTKEDRNRMEDRISTDIQSMELRLTTIITSKHEERREEAKRLHDRIDNVENQVDDAHARINKL